VEDAQGFACNISALYERHALAWDGDRRRSGWNDRIWHDRFVRLLPGGAAVLDLGCGGGSPVAANLVDHGMRVTGVDSSPTLIGICQARLPGQEWIVADMRRLDLGRRFDGILGWDSFFHLNADDQRRMFKVFAAHAAPNAILMFNSGPRHGEAIGTYRGEPLYHASLDPTEYRKLLEDHGFGLLDNAVEDPACGRRTVWLARQGETASFRAAGPGHRA
jgi:SAM-dependent methyltransferase